LTGAALAGAGARTAFLLLAYAIGAAVSLAVALLAGGRIFAALKRSLKAEAWIRGALGVAVLAGVASIVFGLDRGLLTRLSLASTSGIEQSLVDRVQPPANTGSPAMMMMMSSHAEAKASGPAVLPELNAIAWLNSQPLKREALKGHVVGRIPVSIACARCRIFRHGRRNTQRAA
jgi:hypothetical protein